MAVDRTWATWWKDILLQSNVTNSSLSAQFFQPTISTTSWPVRNIVFLSMWNLLEDWLVTAYAGKKSEAGQTSSPYSADLGLTSPGLELEKHGWLSSWTVNVVLMYFMEECYLTETCWLAGHVGMIIGESLFPLIFLRKIHAWWHSRHKLTTYSQPEMFLDVLYQNPPMNQ